jgi:Family of unknown function (DUF5989)
MPSLLTELWQFLRVRKRFWLLPIVLILTLFAGLVLFTQDSMVSPFVYFLF